MTDPAAIAREIIDSNIYMTLGTANERGHPWVSPVYFASGDYTHFYWISTPEARHSQNLVKRPQVSIVVFNSQVPASTGQAVYMSAMAAQVPDGELDTGFEIYPGPPERGGRPVSREQVQPPGPFRLYVAEASEHSILCPREPRQPCPKHGIAHDHRIPVKP